MSPKRTSRPTRQLEPNTTTKRFEHVLKLYWEKYPGACFDTATVAAFLTGIDEAAPYYLLDMSRIDKNRQLSFETAMAAVPERTWSLIGRLRSAGLFPAAAQWTRLPASGHEVPLYDVRAWPLARLAVFVDEMPERHEHESIIPWVARELVALARAKPVNWVQINETRWRGFLEGDVVDDDLEASISLHHTQFSDGAGGVWIAYRRNGQICPPTENIEHLKACVEERELKELNEDLVELLKQKITAIAQWAKETRTDIGKVTVAHALEAISTYKFKTSSIPQGTVVYKFADGWTVQELREAPALKAEGKVMQHCVGSYCDQVKEGNSRIYSLRDPNGDPHVTLEWTPNTDRMFEMAQGGQLAWDEYVALSPEEFLRSRWHRVGNFEQIYGKQNEKPAEKYVPRVREFIEKMFDGNVKALFMLGIRLGQMDLRGKDLRGMDFTDYAHVADRVLQVLDFSGSDMTDCVFSEDTIEDCVFDRCNLTDANFEKCAIHNTTFRNANLRGANFTLARFTGDKTSLKGANVEKASFITSRYGGRAMIEKLISQAIGTPYYSTTREDSPHEQGIYIDESVDDPNDEDDAYPA